MAISIGLDDASLLPAGAEIPAASVSAEGGKG
jgi:hypothetical protein